MVHNCGGAERLGWVGMLGWESEQHDNILEFRHDDAVDVDRYKTPKG
jgi:hypothetical protein